MSADISNEELQKLLEANEKYKKHQASVKQAYKKYSSTEKGKEARRRAMRAFRQREKEKKTKIQN